MSKRNLLSQSKRKLPDFPQLLRSLFPRNGPQQLANNTPTLPIELS